MIYKNSLTVIDLFKKYKDYSYNDKNCVLMKINTDLYKLLLFGVCFCNSKKSSSLVDMSLKVYWKEPF